MSTPDSNNKSINNLKDEVITGESVLGGGKSAPVVIEPVNDATTDVNMPEVLNADPNTGDGPVVL